jgi:hypothetical protein
MEHGMKGDIWRVQGAGEEVIRVVRDLEMFLGQRNGISEDGHKPARNDTSSLG